jgi:hypothetical protein
MPVVGRPTPKALKAAVGDIDTALRTFWKLLNEAYPGRQWGDEKWDKALQEVLPRFRRTADLQMTWLLVLMGLVKPEDLINGDMSARSAVFLSYLEEIYEQWRNPDFPPLRKGG